MSLRSLVIGPEKGGGSGSDATAASDDYASDRQACSVCVRNHFWVVLICMGEQVQPDNHHKKRCSSQRLIASKVRREYATAHTTMMTAKSSVQRVCTCAFCALDCVGMCHRVQTARGPERRKISIGLAYLRGGAHLAQIRRTIGALLTS